MIIVFYCILLFKIFILLFFVLIILIIYIFFYLNVFVMQDRTTETRQDTTKCITRHDRIIQIHVGKKKKTLMRGVTKPERMKFGKRK